MVLMDLAAAFASVAHAWVFAAAGAAAGFPAGLVNAASGLYIDARALHRNAASTDSGFGVTSGVAQGCPLSGLLFVVALDGFLCWLSRLLARASPRYGPPARWSAAARADYEVLAAVAAEIGKPAADLAALLAPAAFACADDVGLVTRRLSSMRLAARVYDVLARATSLQLKPPKCIVVPLAGGPFDEIAAATCLWLRKFLPQWAELSVSLPAVYLGVLLGPRAGGKQTELARAKRAE